MTLQDVVAEDGRAEGYAAHANTSEEWTTLTVWAQKVLPPAPGDNFSLGLFGVEVGEWFEVRELSLFVGILPLRAYRAEGRTPEHRPRKAPV